MANQTVTEVLPSRQHCVPCIPPVGRTLLVALGVITMIGGLVATGCLYQSTGALAFTFTGGGLLLGSIPILIVACKRAGRVERSVVRLAYDGTLTPAQERLAKKPSDSNMSDFSSVEPGVVQYVQQNRLEQHQERSIGVMLGMAVGDTCGIPFERLPFRLSEYTQAAPQSRYLPGQWTDATAMGLSLAEMLIAGELNETQLMWVFYDVWQHGYNTAHISVNLSPDLNQALQHFDERNVSRDNTIVLQIAPIQAVKKPLNGSLMRNGPVAVSAKTIEEARALAARQSRVTHNNAEVAACCEFMAFILFQAIHDPSSNPAEIKQRLLESFQDFDCTVDSVNALVCRGTSPNTTSQEWEVWNWLDATYTFTRSLEGSEATFAGSDAIDALAIALHCVFTTETFEEAVQKAARRGGEATVIGAITGQIAGAIYGRERIPQQWVDQVQQWDRGGEIAARGYLLTL